MLGFLMNFQFFTLQKTTFEFLMSKPMCTFYAETISRENVLKAQFRDFGYFAWTFITSLWFMLEHGRDFAVEFYVEKLFFCHVCSRKNCSVKHKVLKKQIKKSHKLKRQKQI